MLQRAVALEIRELDIVTDPTEEEPKTPVSLHISLAREDGVLFVSVWDRGEFVGKKSVTDSTSSRVLARRVALAISELGRWLSAKRMRLEREAEIKRAEEVRRRERERARAKLRALRVRAAAESLMIFDGGWLVGPTLGLEFNKNYPLRFIPHIGWMAGSLPGLGAATLGETAPAWSQFEFGLGLDWVMKKPGGLDLNLGALAAVSAVHVSGAVDVDGILGQRDTWTARLGLRFGTSRNVTEVVRARVDVSAGSLLRAVPISAGGERENIGGAFAGLSLGVSLAPALNSTRE